MIKRFIHFWNGNFTAEERRDAEWREQCKKIDAAEHHKKQRESLLRTIRLEETGYYVKHPWWKRWI